MSIEVDVDLTGVEAELSAAAMDLMKDSTEAAQTKARSEARVDDTDMRDGIMVFAYDQGEGYMLIATMDYTIFHEFGTGIHGVLDDQWEGGVASHRQDSWVYFDEDEGQFFTTSGVTPKPMIGPGYDVGKAYFNAEARRRFA